MFKTIQDSSDSNHAQTDKRQLSVVLFIAWCVVIAQDWF